MSAEKSNFNNNNNLTHPIQTITTPPFASTSGFYPVQTNGMRGSENPPPAYVQTQNVYQTFQVPVIVPFGLFHKSPQHLVRSCFF